MIDTKELLAAVEWSERGVALGLYPSELDRCAHTIRALIEENARLRAELAESDETVAAFENGTQEQLNARRLA